MAIPRPYHPSRPLAHMHVQKNAGTSLHKAFIAVPKPERTAVGLGRHHFGGVQASETMPEQSSTMLLLTPESMREDAQYVGSHIAYPDARSRYADARFIAVAREPFAAP